MITLPSDVASSLLFIMAVCGFGFFCVITYRERDKQLKKEAEENKIQNRKKALKAFYQECLKEGCNNFDSEKSREKMKLIANRYKLELLIDETEISDPEKMQTLFELAKEEVLAQERRESEAARYKVLRETRTREEKQFHEWTKYADFSGRDKRIAMVRDAVTENRRTAEALERTANGMLENSQQREHNAATWGGIANGLAGAGAGISTALQTELENIQIRANNARRREELLPVWQDAMTTAARYKNLAAAGEELIRKTQVALVAETEASAVLKKLKNTRNPEVEVSITGAVTVNAYLKLGKKETIFGNVPAVVDGTIVAQVLDNGQEIAKVNLVCPLQGIGADKEVKLRGMALVNADPKKKYTVAFGAYNLWLMEE